jgi:hypothetical protein
LNLREFSSFPEQYRFLGCSGKLDVIGSKEVERQLPSFPSLERGILGSSSPNEKKNGSSVEIGEAVSVHGSEVNSEVMSRVFRSQA